MRQGRCEVSVLATHAGAATDVAFRDRTAGGLIERSPGVFGADVKAIDVVQVAVPGLRDHGQ